MNPILFRLYGRWLYLWDEYSRAATGRSRQRFGQKAIRSAFPPAREMVPDHLPRLY